MSKNNKLQVILTEQGIEKSDVAKLIEAFGGPFEEAGEILDTYKTIVVTKEDDVAGMNKAREARLLLKKARTTVENKRVELKADIVKQGRAIDSVARFVKEEIQPAEEYLELQEKFAEIQREQRVAKIKAERIEKLMQYTDDISVYNLDQMTPEQFEGLLSTLKVQYEAKIKAEEEARKKALEEAEAERKRQAEIEKENIRLKKEAEEKEAEREAERKLEAEKNEKLEAEAKLEREKREALELKEKQQKEAEQLAKDQEEAEKLKALTAPDKEKLMQFAQGIHIVQTQKMPTLKSKEAQEIAYYIENVLSDLYVKIIEKAKEL